MLKSIIRILVPVIIIGLGLLVWPVHNGAQQGGNELLNHDLRVVMYPREHRFTAEDTIRVPEDFPRNSRFVLHKGLNPAARTKGVRIAKDTGRLPHPYLESYSLSLPHGLKTFAVSFGGAIDHPLKQVGKEQARGYSNTMGKIAEEGVYLSGYSHWYPVFDAGLFAFSLTIDLPRSWSAISQGERVFFRKDPAKTTVSWVSPEPQEEIYLVAGKFHEYRRSIGDLQALVFLRTADQILAEKYLHATARYIPLYEELIGPYPYKKFALVENFWETGFGMPSFTLIGPKVIRFPFILNTSYPHEILHTWWGNSVFPDYSQGNWAEGLTAYLSDHLTAEQQGGGADYRQTALQKYTDYASGGDDFPLTAFRSRHSSSSEAIGYGKSMMFFHMLRRELGDGIFVEGLRDFYKVNKFRFASFDDLRKSFERMSGKNLGNIFTQWITRSGAPELKIQSVQVHPAQNGYVLTAAIDQVQEGKPYHFLLPVAVTLQGQDQTFQTSVAIDRKRVEISLNLRAQPLRVDFDPEFDVFRKLNRNEIPPAITQVLGGNTLTVILPSSAEPSLLGAYRTFAESLRNAGPDRVEIKLDREVAALPSENSVCIMGMENRYSRIMMEALSGYRFKMDQKSMHIAGSGMPLSDHSIVLTGRNPENREMTLLAIVTENPDALKGLSRKLPHYHKYSYLAFKGNEPENVLKGRWPVKVSPMTVFLEDAPFKGDMGRLNTRRSLADARHASGREH